MTETALMGTDLELLAQRVERAAALVQQLRDERARLENERNELADRVQDVERKLQGQDVGVLIQELTTLRREQREWQGERREVASRIEALARRLEKLDT